MAITLCHQIQFSAPVGAVEQVIAKLISGNSFSATERQSAGLAVILDRFGEKIWNNSGPGRPRSTQRYRGATRALNAGVYSVSWKKTLAFDKPPLSAFLHALELCAL